MIAKKRLFILLFCCGCVQNPALTWERQAAKTKRLVEQGKLSDAIESAQRALDLAQRELDYGDPARLRAMHELALVYALNGYEDEAVSLWKTALQIARRIDGFSDYDVILYAANLARLYHLQGDYSQAEPLYVLSYAVWKQTQGLSLDQYQELAVLLSNYSSMLEEVGRKEEARSLERAVENAKRGF